MVFTRPKASQINFDVTNISDTLIRLNSGQTGSADKDVGLVIERGDDTNTALLFDESADQFVLVNTTEDGTTSGNVTISSYAGLQANAIVYGSLNDGTTTLTSTVAELNILDGVTSTATELNLLDGITGITLGNANETLIVGTGGTSITTTDLLAFDTVNTRAGIGTTSPAVKFHVAGEGSANEGQIRLQQAYNGSDGPDFAFYASRGTIASPTSTADNDNQGRINAYVHNGTNFVQSGSFGWSSDGTDGDNTFDIRSRVGGTIARRIEVVASGDIEFQDGAFDVDVKSHDGTNGLKLGGTLVTSSAAELNILDGVTATAAELNILDGVTATTAELNILDGVTSSAAELNILDGVTATATELNLLDGVTGIALGNANELVIVDSDGTGFASSSTLSIDDGNNYIGINQTSPEVTLHMTGDGAQTAQIRMEQHNDSADAPDVRTRRSRGTAASPSNLNAGDYLFRINAEAYQSGTYATLGSIQLDTSSSDVSKGVIQFQTHDGSSLATRLQILDSGAIRFNSAYTFPTADGSANRVLATDGSGTLSFVDQSGGLSNIVEDTTPQLGGNLDTNSNNILIDDAHFIADENTNEQIVFQTTASAVNSFQITNAATGNAIELASVGGDTNIGMNLVTKGSGEITLDTLAVSDLTAGRIPYIGTSGAITDAANLTWNNSGGDDSNGLLTAQNITVNNRLAGGASGFKFFAFNEDTVDVKFANWFTSSDHQYGMGMLYYETYFAALEDTDSGTDQQRRFGFYLETPDNGASDTAGSASTQGTNYRLAITRDSLRLNNANPIRMYENNSGAVGTNYIELDWPASITSNAIINVPAVAGHLAVLGAAPTETITSTPAELNILDGVTATTAELNLLDGITGVTLDSAGDLLIVGSDGTSVDSSALLNIDTGNGRLGIGTSSPARTLHLVGDTQFEGSMRIDQYHTSSDGPDILFQKARGTPSSTTAAANGDELIKIVGLVHDGTDFQTRVRILSDTVLDGSDYGANIQFQTGDGAAPTTRFTIAEDGNITVADGAFDFDIAAHDGTNGLKLGGTLVTSSAAELNYVDGVTSAIQTQLDAKLALAGGTMSGAIAMGTNKITGMGDPTANQDAATKAYVDTQTSSIVTTTDIAGDTGTDTVTLGSDTLTFSGTANEVVTAVTNNTVTISLPDNVTIGGDATVTGNLTVNGTTTTISTTNSVVSDSLIELNTGAASNANDLGIVMERGSTGDNAIIAWDESSDSFILGTTTATGASTGDLTITAGELSIGSLSIPDGSSTSNYLGIGNSDDFKIYHDGSQTVISNVNGSGPIKLQGKFGEQSIVANQDGAVELYYNNAKKLETTADGVNILSVTNNGPIVDLISNDPTDAADFSAEGQLRFFAENDASESVQYAHIKMTTADITDGTEDGRIAFNVINNGSLVSSTQIGAGYLFLLHDTHRIQWQNTRGTNFNIDLLPAATPTANREIFLPDATGTVLLADGSGASLTSLNATQLTSGTVPNARLDQQLQDVAGLAVTNGGFIVGDGSNFVLETGSTARASLGLGTAATSATGDFATAAQGTTADSALQDLVDDTSPQLGGNLASNGNDIVMASGDQITAVSNGTNAVLDIAGGGPNFIRFRPGSDFSTNAGGVDIKYRTTPDDLLIERSENNNIIAEFGGDDGHAALYFDDSKKLETLTGGVDITGNITVSGTVDGRDLATDGTKLDGIEASADVTDTANVTAAGALMDSEVTNLAQVKAFDSSDYATAAQGTTADSALQDLSDDTSPTLGGALSTGGNQIQLSQTSGVAIKTSGNLGSADLTLLRASSDGVNQDGQYGFDIRYMGSRSGNANSFALEMHNQAGTNVEAITVYQDGKVGINNTTPTAPLDVGGNIVVSGTVDGRDLATDGSKLDGIASSATANPNALDNVVEDTTPQLGGDLESNGNHILMGDSNAGNSYTNRVKFGVGEELQIFCDGSGGFIQETGGGNLTLTSNSTQIKSADYTETIATFNQNGSVDLYYDNSKKLETTTDGVTVTGLLSATTKSFDIPHPTKENMRLRYGSLEGPENGVYVRGRLTNSSTIELPEHWAGLVHEDSITVQLTAIGKQQDLWVEEVNILNIKICSHNTDCFYMVMAERKDVERLEVEYEN